MAPGDLRHFGCNRRACEARQFIGWRVLRALLHCILSVSGTGKPRLCREWSATLSRPTIAARGSRHSGLDEVLLVITEQID